MLGCVCWVTLLFTTSVGLRYSPPHLHLLHLLLGYATLHPTYIYCWVTLLSTPPTSTLLGYATLHPTYIYCWVTLLSTPPTSTLLGYATLHPTYIYCWVTLLSTPPTSTLLGYATLHPTYIYSVGLRYSPPHLHLTDIRGWMKLVREIIHLREENPYRLREVCSRGIVLQLNYR